jgi:hypothetical protein
MIKPATKCVATDHRKRCRAVTSQITTCAPVDAIVRSLTGLGHWFNDPIPEYDCTPTALALGQSPLPPDGPASKPRPPTVGTCDTYLAREGCTALQQGQGVKALSAFRQLSAGMEVVA